jgi:NAD(P)-dependent dehydrogenase (short-subunit alcohol dehydrogenase family)
VKYLEESSGRIIVISSIGAQLRSALGSDYGVRPVKLCQSKVSYADQITKHALNRMVEFIAQGLRSYFRRTVI